MEGNFATRVRRMVDELEEHSEFDVEASVQESPMPQLTDPDWVFADIRARKSVPLSPRFAEYFFPYLNIRASWESVAGPEINGEFSLKHIHRCVVARQDLLQDPALSDADQQLLPELKIFDEEPDAGSGRVANLRIKAGVVDPEVWLYDMNHERLELLDLDYGSYLEALLITRGTYGWQYLFADVDLAKPRFRDIVQNVKNMLEVFPRLFPQHSYASTRERLEARL